MPTSKKADKSDDLGGENREFYIIVNKREKSVQYLMEGKMEATAEKLESMVMGNVFS